jgi:exopolyphosphatase/guanosine-5'-triphosphate,3'-diphosphate pyrophosphatase
VLLTVGERTAEGWQTLLETSAVTALGEGVKGDGLIRQPNAAATLQAIQIAFSAAAELGAEPRAFGTMALRIAANAAGFLSQAEQQGTQVTVISGTDEAELGLASVLDDSAFSNERGVTVVDVGGHSTEISTVATRHSHPVGTLGLRSRFLALESPPAGAILQATAEIDSMFENVEAAKGIVVGLGASVTNLASIRAELQEWDPDAVHGSYLDYEEVSRFVGRSMRMTEAERAEMVGIERGRERTVHIGALIVERALAALSVEGIYVSVRGWRHAMLDRGW